MSRSPVAPPGAPRRGRPPGWSPPVTIVTISLDPATLRDIDEYAVKSGRTRSAFVRGVMRNYIASRRAESHDDSDLDTWGGVVKDAETDRTHGGRFDPSLIGGADWPCVACEAETVDHPDGPANSRVVSGWIVCPGCATPRPPADLAAARLLTPTDL